jgi:hypothetical protein
VSEFAWPATGKLPPNQLPPDGREGKVLRATWPLAQAVPAGFQAMRLRFDIAAPEATPEQLSALSEKTEQYCVVLQTLAHPPKLETRWNGLR